MYSSMTFTSRNLSIAIFCGMTIVGCGGSTEENYEIYARAVLHPSCQPSVITIKQVRDELTGAGVFPQTEFCATDGLLHSGSCGSPIGYLHVIEISADKISNIKALGYVAAAEYPKLVRTDCPLL